MANNIGVIAQDIVTRINTVPALQSRVGLAVGGTENDPVNRELPHPGVWILYVGDSLIANPEMNACNELIKLNFVVKVITDYDDQSGLINTQLPLLHDIVQVVRGQEAVAGSKWLYEGQQMEQLTPERMVWAQNYSILVVI